jgi:hypothetical protein
MKKSLIGLTALALTACGGGGGSNSSLMQLQSAPAPAQPFSIPTATLIGVNSYYLTYGESANSGSVPFNGQLAHTSTSKLTVVDGDSTVTEQTNTEYYLQDPYTPLGGGSSSATPYELVFNSVSPLPDMLTVNDSGPLASGSLYTPGTQSIIGSLSETYSVAPYNSTLLKLNISTTGSLSGTPISQVVSYTVDAFGNVFLNAFELTLPTGTTVYFNLPAP